MSQSFIPYHSGRVAETEWGPIHGNATQNWLEECIKKTKKLQRFASRFSDFLKDKGRRTDS